MRHPAAALAAWKSAGGPPRELGKPLEALIACFNPEMSGEWRVLDGARLAVNLDEGRGVPSWHALVPRDDGTIAAAVAAMRLSDGASEAPVDFAGNRIAVERLGRPGAALAARRGRYLDLRQLARRTGPRRAEPGRWQGPFTSRGGRLGKAASICAELCARCEPDHELAADNDDEAGHRRVASRAIVPPHRRKLGTRGRRPRPRLFDGAATGGRPWLGVVERFCSHRSGLARARAGLGRHGGDCAGLPPDPGILGLDFRGWPIGLKNPIPPGPRRPRCEPASI